jgi:hypothetical protein
VCACIHLMQVVEDLAIGALCAAVELGKKFDGLQLSVLQEAIAQAGEDGKGKQHTLCMYIPRTAWEYGNDCHCGQPCTHRKVLPSCMRSRRRRIDLQLCTSKPCTSYRPGYGT